MTISVVQITVEKTELIGFLAKLKLLDTGF